MSGETKILGTCAAVGALVLALSVMHVTGAERHRPPRPGEECEFARMLISFASTSTGCSTAEAILRQQPIVQPQARNVLKVARIVCYEYEVVDNGGRRD